MKKILIMLSAITALTCVSANAEPITVTTSGSPTTSDTSISMDVTFNVIANGSLNYLEMTSISTDAERDAVRFTGSDQLTIEVNGIPMATSFQDWNDGFGNFHPAGVSWIWFGSGPSVFVGDVVRIFGTAVNGVFAFGNDASTFSTMPSGDYEMQIYMNAGRVLLANSSRVPEPGPMALLVLGLVMIGMRRFKKS